MGFFGKIFRKKQTQGSLVCDVCNFRISSPEGHLLTTTEVVSSPEYWRRYYEAHKTDFIVFKIYSYEGFCHDPIMGTGCVKTVASQTKPWLVCENCITLFNVDLEKTQKYAKQWWQSNGTFKPPGTGPAPLSIVKMVNEQ